MDINFKIQEFNNKYQQLRRCEFPIIKKTIIAEIRKLAQEAESMMRNQQCAQNSKRRRQINDILMRCEQVQQQIEIKPERESVQNYRNTLNVNRMSCQQNLRISKGAMRLVIMHIIRSSELVVAPEQLEEVIEQMQHTNELIRQVDNIVREQGNNLQRIEEYLEHAEQNVHEANLELEDAIRIQHRTRMLKLRLAVTGFFAGLGYKILGLPGLLLGMVFGYKSSS